MGISLITSTQELAVWRKQATISVQEEFTGKTLPPGLEDALPTNLAETFDVVRSGVRRSAESYIQLCTLAERLAKRQQGLATDELRFAAGLRAVAEESGSVYAVDRNDVPLLNEGLGAAAKHLEQSHGLREDEARAWDAGVLEDLKRVRDGLVSVRDMFDRRDRYARNNIPQLERRIEANETKLAALLAKPEGTVKPEDQEKVEQAIRNVRPIPPLTFFGGPAASLTPALRRTSGAFPSSTRAASSSASASATSSSSSRARSTRSAGCTRTGARSWSSTRSCRRTTGAR